MRSPGEDRRLGNEARTVAYRTHRGGVSAPRTMRDRMGEHPYQSSGAFASQRADERHGRISRLGPYRGVGVVSRVQAFLLVRLF